MKNKTKNTPGFILIEILVSLLLMTTGILFLINSLSTITKSNHKIRNNRLAYTLLDNVFNQLYSGEAIIPGKVVLNNKEFFWDFAENKTDDGLSHILINVSWGKNNSASTASLSHTTIDLNR